MRTGMGMGMGMGTGMWTWTPDGGVSPLSTASCRPFGLHVIFPEITWKDEMPAASVRQFIPVNVLYFNQQ